MDSEKQALKHDFVHRIAQWLRDDNRCEELLQELREVGIHQAMLKDPSLRVVNVGDAPVSLSGFNMEQQTLGHGQEARITPISLGYTEGRALHSQLSSSFLYLSHAISLFMANSSDEQGVIELDLTSLPLNRAGALVFVLERGSKGTTSELHGVPSGGTVKTIMPPSGYVRLTGMGFSLLMEPIVRHTGEKG